jgi:PKD domain
MKNLLLILVCISFFCCKDSFDTNPAIPYALFNTYNEKCIAPCEVSFTNLTKTLFDTEFLWEFGDGDTSTDFSPRHLYYESGKFNVRLTATNAAGSTIFDKFVEVEKNKALNLLSTCRIESVTLTKVTNNKPDGSRWDESTTKDSLADFAWLVLDKDNVEVNRDEGLGDGFNISQKDLPFIKKRVARFRNMRNFTDTYKLIIFDEDGGPYDIMVEQRFRPIDYFPQQPDGATGIIEFRSYFSFEKNGIAYDVVMQWQ